MHVYVCVDCVLFSVSELLAKVKMSLKPPFRPHLPEMEGHIAGEWIGLAKNCWQTETHKRPTFRTVKSILLAHHSGKYVGLRSVFCSLNEKKKVLVSVSLYSIR